MNIAFPLRIISVTVLGIAAGISLAARAQTPDSEKIRELFKEINIHAVEAQDDAQVLESYTRSPKISPQGHANGINQMNAHVRDLREDFNTAKSLRPLGSAWQKDAIDQIEPLLQQMADHLTVSINHLNNNHRQTQMQPWVDYVRANRDFANKTARLIHDYVDYGEAKAKSESLERSLATLGQG